MTDPVNLSNLHEMTGGDVDVEQELFKVFLESAKECTQGLIDALQSQNSEEWRKHAHAFKGISLNLGADYLGGLCKAAQDAATAPTEAKQAMLSGIRTEAAKVEAFLQNLLP